MKTSDNSGEGVTLRLRGDRKEKCFKFICIELFQMFKAAMDLYIAGTILQAFKAN